MEKNNCKKIRQHVPIQSANHTAAYNAISWISLLASDVFLRTTYTVYACNIWRAVQNPYSPPIFHLFILTPQSLYANALDIHVCMNAACSEVNILQTSLWPCWLFPCMNMSDICSPTSEYAEPNSHSTPLLGFPTKCFVKLKLGKIVFRKKYIFFAFEDSFLHDSLQKAKTFLFRQNHLYVAELPLIFFHYFE